MVSTVSAYDLTASDFTDITVIDHVGHWDGENIIISGHNATNWYFVYEYDFDLLSSSEKVYSCSDEIIALCIDYDGKLIILNSDGQVIKINSAGLVNYDAWKAHYPTEPYDITYMQLINDFPGSDYNDIITDSDGNIFVAYDRYIYKLTRSSGYTLSLVYTSDSADEKVQRFAWHPDGLIFTLGYDGVKTGTTTQVIVYDGSSFSTLYDSDDNYIRYANNLNADTNGNLYLVNGDDLICCNASDSYNDFIIENTGTYVYYGSDILTIGAVYEGINGHVKSYSTLDGYGGFSGYAASEGEYQNKLIESLYDSYYNNQDVKTHYSVATGILNETEQQYFKTTYGVQVEMIDESESLVDSFFVDGSEFDEYDFTNPAFNWFTNAVIDFLSDDVYMFSSGYYDFSNTDNWETGNYTLILYEVNKYSGNKALLDTDSFFIQNASSPYSNTTAQQKYDYPEGSGGTGDFGDMLDNIIVLMTTKAFWGVIIWVGVTLGVAQRRDSYNIDTKQIGIFSAILAILLAIAGAFDPYKWFVISICIIFAAIGFVAVGKQFSGTGGNE